MTYAFASSAILLVALYCCIIPIAFDIVGSLLDIRTYAHPCVESRSRL